MGMTEKINLDQKFGLFSDHWDAHETEDEFFMVWKGQFRVEFRDRVVSLGPGECVVVPRGIEHRTCADIEAEILCFEPQDVQNTGNVTDAVFTAPMGAKI
jgi:mannose-6-phosphate isomerase-like protein (cupin superfamily)